MKLNDIEKASSIHAYRAKLIAMKAEIHDWHENKHTDLFMFGPEVLDPLDNKTLPVDVRHDKAFRAVIQFLHTLTKLAEENLRSLGVVIPAEVEEKES